MECGEKKSSKTHFDLTNTRALENNLLLCWLQNNQARLLMSAQRKT